MSDAPKDAILSLHVYTCAAENLHTVDGNYFEIGVFNGIGTANIAKSYPNKLVFAIDPFIEDGHTGTGDRGIPLNNQREAYYENVAGLENITLFETTSSEFAKTLTDEMIDDMNIQWVTIDGSHHYEDVAIDYELAMRLLGKKSGYVLFDDLAHIGVRKAYYEFMAKYIERIVGCQQIGDGGAVVCKIVEA